jgi:glycosyltransferase involved in cell wall biosynthesis
MRVAMLTCVYPPYGGGIGEVARQYAALLTAEHQVTVFTPKYIPGMTFVVTPGVAIAAKRPLIAWGKAAWLTGLGHDLKKFDAVHLHYPFFGVHERLPKLAGHIKLVITYHMLPQAAGIRGVFMKLSRRYSSKALAVRASVMTIATNDYLEAVALPEMGEAAKWQVVPFGVDERFRPGEQSEILIRRFNLHYGEQVILFVGTLDKAHYFKGLTVLLEAVAKLTSRNWKLIVVGGGGMRRQYERQARLLKLGQRVAFAGYVPVTELPDYYRLANLFILPSINQAEAFGLAALEAMASGRPVIASRLPGVRELVRHGETGILVQPQDALALAAAIENLLASPMEQQRLAQNALREVELNYRWTAVGRKLLAIYRAL